MAISSEVFRLIFEQSPFSIQILSPDGRTLQVNAAWEKLWGLKIEQLQNYNVLEDPQLVAKGVMPYIRRGFAGEAVAIPPMLYDPVSTVQGGHQRWVRAFIYALRDVAGDIEYLVLAHEDVTQRMRAGETLHKSREQLTAVLDALDDCITVQDKSGNIVYSNQAAAHLMGFERAAALIEVPQAERLARFEVFDEDGQPLPLDKLPARRVLRGEPENQATLRFFMRMTGAEYWANVRAVPVYDLQGEVCFAISIFHDISQRKQSEDERLRLLERIESKRAMLEAVLQQLPVGVLIIDVISGQMTRVNKQFSDIWRYPKELLLDNTWFARGRGFHPDGRPLQGKEWPLQRALAEEHVSQQEIQIVRGDNTCGTVQMSAGPVRDAAGHLIAVVETLVDVTERKEVEEQIRFQARLLETVGQGVIASDVQGQIIYWNQAAEKIFGWKREEVIGKDVMSLMTTRNTFSSSEAVMELVKQGGRWQGETEVHHRDGHIVPLLTALSPVLDEQNQVVGMIGTSTDLTERKKEEEGQRLLAEAGAVLASSLDYVTTLESVARLAVPTVADWCSVDILDENGELQRLAITHQDPEKIAWGYELYRRYPPDMNSTMGVPHVLRTGQAELLEDISDEFLEQVVKDPVLLQIVRDLNFRSSIVAPLTARGRTLGAITFISAESGRRYDQDDLKLAEELARRAGLAMDNARLYQEAQQARESAERANRAKDEFLAMLSHELRTPLTSMVGWLDLLRSKMLGPAEEEQALAAINRGTRTQAQLIEDLLDVSRIITGKMMLVMQPVALPPIVEAAVESIRPAAVAKQIDLRLNLARDTMRVTGDESRLQQIVGNILSNAVKFTPPNGLIEVTLQAHEGQARLAIRDSGRGIAPEFLPQVFERFRQADSTSTRNHGGLGIGLSIVSHLVEKHGGSVEVQSAGEGQGATFTVILPLLSVENSSSSSASPDLSAKRFVGRDNFVQEVLPSPNEFAGSGQNSGQLQGTKVLVVEDEPDTLFYIETVLRREGAFVKSASSALGAMDVLSQWRPDVMISDIGMPVTDGYGLLKQVRLLPVEQGGDIPVMALTAFARPEDRERALQAGFQEFLAKPVQPDQIVKAVALLAEPKPTS